MAVSWLVCGLFYGLTKECVGTIFVVVSFLFCGCFMA